MDEWIQLANLNAFRRMVASETDSERRQRLEQLLSQHESRVESEIAARLMSKINDQD